MEVPRVFSGDQSDTSVPVVTASTQVDREVFLFHNLMVTIKLDHSNFMIWTHQVLKDFKKLRVR